jgi:hypothetical protein
MKPIEGSRREDNGPSQRGKLLYGMKNLHEENSERLNMEIRKSGTKNVSPVERHLSNLFIRLNASPFRLFTLRGI